MRLAKASLLVAALLATPVLGADITISLLGTTDGLATRDITVGPPIAPVTDTIVDPSMTTGLSNSITLGTGGGAVDVFFLASVPDTSSAGLASFVWDFSSDTAGASFSTASFDVVYRDFPGRMASFLGTPMPLPEERRIADHPADTMFHQSYTNPFGAAVGSGGASLTDVGAGSSALTTTGDSHTFGIGQRGNDGTTGPTSLGWFTVTVPANPGPDAVTYVISGEDQVSLTYVDSPMFSDPPSPSSVIQLRDVIDSESLSITVLPEPTSLLLLAPVVLLAGRRRRA